MVYLKGDDLEKVFNEVLKNIKESKNGDSKLPDNVRLDFYKFYKQAIEGDCNIPKPNMFQFEDNAKWTAWNSVKGMTSDDAKNNYIDLFQSLA